MRHSVLLIASKTGYQTRVFAEAATALGFDVALATDRCHVLEDPWGDNATAVRFDEPEAASLTLARRFPHIEGVLAVGDRPTTLAALTAQRLGLDYHAIEAVEICRSKHRLRSALSAAGLLAPAHYLLSLEERPNSARWYPCVLKPLGLSASRGVIRANDDAEFAAAFGRIRHILELSEIREHRDRQDRFIQVEQFIPGREFAFEGVVEAGQLHVFAVFDKPDPLDGPYFEETIYVQPARVSTAVRQNIAAAAAAGVRALGLRRGPVHGEMRVNEAGVWILEIAARPIGGLCAQSLRFQEGSPLEHVLLRHAAGENIGSLRLAPAASGVMMIPIPRNGLYRGVTGLDKSALVNGIENVVITAKEGQRFQRLPEGNSYLGFLFARAETAGEVEEALRRAHARLEFDFATELSVV